MGYGDKLDDIIETAVARGTRPGVAAVVRCSARALTDTIRAERAVTVRDLLTSTWASACRRDVLVARTAWMRLIGHDQLLAAA
jgi:hypothetical protein